MVVVVGDIVEGTINVNHKAIVEVLIKVYFATISRRNATFIRSQITSQLDTPLIDERRHIISFAKAHETSETKKLL